MLFKFHSESVKLVYCRMADLFQILDGKRRQYFDRTRFSNFTEQEEAKAASKTVYVGNLSFYTREEQIYSLMSKGKLRFETDEAATNHL